VAVLAKFGAADPPPAPPFTRASPREDVLAWFADLEPRAEELFAAVGVPEVAGVSVETTRIPGPDGTEISLFVHRPQRASGRLSCVVHLHGGGMTVLRAVSPWYARFRDELAASGLVVVGVEFRNAAGALGNHPYPAGVSDCAMAVRWAGTNLDELGGTHVVVSGDSGGGNLSLAVAIKARREGWLDHIAGVYGQCPWVISGAYQDPPEELPSLREFDGHFFGWALLSLQAEVYDPGSAHGMDPLCWPGRTGGQDLTGLAPYVISVNELDALRDEGFAYDRKLGKASVPAIGRMVAGTSHGADIDFGAAIREGARRQHPRRRRLRPRARVASGSSLRDVIASSARTRITSARARCSSSEPTWLVAWR
jgi:acetyl esterase/lipase